jgi:serine/threonine protein kinase
VAEGEILDGRYRITRRVGGGGMGEVYRAERTRLGDEVAVKFVRADDRGSDPLSRERFMSEGRLAAALRHPNIVSVLDVGIDSVRGPFLVMEYLNGPTLAQEIAASGVIAPTRAVEILAGLASAMDHAHSMGLVHRDLKPANVVAHRYGNGAVVYKIIDFGIGTLTKGGDLATTRDRHLVMGSLAYAAPEQLLGEQVDGRADIYSLGALAFEMLTGRVPFLEPDVNTLFARVQFAAPPTPSALNPNLDRHIDEALIRALAKQPGRRWPTAAAFTHALAGGQTTRTEGADSRRPLELRQRYDLDERIDTGRLGSEIWAGRHRAIGSAVVVRILRRSATAAWETGRTRFLREARAMQAAHPSILRVRDFGEEPDLVYVVTDRIAGSSLRELIDAERRVAWPRARRFILDLIGAGLAVHRQGGLIFGLTPAIVRVHGDGPEERLVISSAGIAEIHDVLAGASADALRALEIPTSDLLYVAPEVLLGEEPDGRTDIYTVGILAYEMVTGRARFTALTVPQLVAQIFSGGGPDLRELAPDLPAAAADVINTCTAPRPDRRYADLAELQSAWLATPERA